MKLLRLRQGNLTISAYSAEFHKITIMISDIHDAEAKHLFIEHLNKDIALHVVDKNRTTLADAIAKAQNAEDFMHWYGDQKIGDKKDNKDKGKGCQQSDNYLN